MTYAEFVNQVAFYRAFPWGDDWRQTMSLHATMMNCSPKYRTFNLDKYFPQQRKKQSSLLGMFDALKNIALGKK